MKYILRLEGVAYLIAGAVSYFTLFDGWVIFAILFFFPDLSIIFYLINNKVGAWCYNIAHHVLTVILLLGLGYWLDQDIWTMLALVQLTHIGFDRILGYGLKYPTHFKETHLDKF